MHRTVTIALLAFLTACGGGGSGDEPADVAGDTTTPPPSDAVRLQGTYGVHAIEGTPTSLPVHGYWGVRDADGAGAFPLTATRNDGATVEAFAQPPRTYDVSGNELVVRNSGGTQDGAGFVTTDGGLAGWVTTQGPPTIELLTRKSSGWAGTIASTWLMVLFVYTSGGQALIVGELDFDGSGSVELRGTAADASSLGPFDHTGTYILTSDGTVIVTFPLFGLSGQLHASGNAMFLSGATNALPLLCVGAAVRGSGAATASMFSGTYGALHIRDTATGVEVGHRTATADGVDSMRLLEGTANLEGAGPTARPAEIHTYGTGVASLLVLDGGAAGFVLLSADGEVAMRIPTIPLAAGPPSLTILVRQ